MREQYLGDGLREQLASLRPEGALCALEKKKNREHLIMWTLYIFQEMKPPMLLFPD